MKENKLSSILYYDLSERKNAQLKKRLNEYKFLLTAMDSALIALEKGDLEKFDSLVGENACQIRAVKIAMMASKGQIDFFRLKETISTLNQKIDELLFDKTISSLMSSDISLKEVIINEGLEMELSSDEMFLLKAFLLSEMKAPHPDGEWLSTLVIQDKTRPANLKQYGDVSTNFATELGRKLRRLLSEASVDFIKELAWLGEVSVNDYFMVSDKFLHVHNDAWPTLPMFWTYKVLLQASLKENIPLIIKAKFLKHEGDQYQVKDEETLFFKPVEGENGSTYILAEPDEMDLEKPACMVKGILLTEENEICKMKWTEELTKTSILDVILAGAADHRQYPDPSVEVQVDDPDFENYISMAKEKGFSIDNPSTFFINHVYPVQVGKAVGLSTAEQRQPV